VVVINMCVYNLCHDCIERYSLLSKHPNLVNLQRRACPIYSNTISLKTPQSCYIMYMYVYSVVEKGGTVPASIIVLFMQPLISVLWLTNDQ
jgi:hypothetical protein